MLGGDPPMVQLREFSVFIARQNPRVAFSLAAHALSFAAVTPICFEAKNRLIYFYSRKRILAPPRESLNTIHRATERVLVQ